MRNLMDAVVINADVRQLYSQDELRPILEANGAYDVVQSLFGAGIEDSSELRFFFAGRKGGDEFSPYNWHDLRRGESPEDHGFSSNHGVITVFDDDPAGGTVVVKASVDTFSGEVTHVRIGTYVLD
jgi:hypothetical protein